MPRKNKQKHTQGESLATKNRFLAEQIINTHPLFSLLAWRTTRSSSPLCPSDGWAVVRDTGEIYVNGQRFGEPEEWSYVYAHCILHLGFGHFKQKKEHPQIWNAACDLYIAQFLRDLKFGQPPLELQGLLSELAAMGIPTVKSEEWLYDELCVRGLPEGLQTTGTGGSTIGDMLPSEHKPSRSSAYYQGFDWQEQLAKGLEQAVADAVDIVGGATRDTYEHRNSAAWQALNWFITHYPLLGALAASFKIIEDPLLCQRMSISVAAVNMELREIYINPHAALNNEELRFVMAHELLHVGLRHDVRCESRDFYLWNVACDYVINAWLIEMGVGTMPQIGALYDPELKGESAEAIYDHIVRDLRHYRKLATLRGTEMGDMLNEPSWWMSREGRDLDEFYRNALSQGLTLHQELGRGYISADLIEEIQALSQPPIPWDVELARWFDRYFTPIEKVRTYARMSRRQSATPDIPRPHWVAELPDDNRTFGVLLDTSGSMDRNVLAKALGAIASYSIARDVSQVRVVFCDAVTYDQGYMAPEDIAGRVKVRGRGGTILQPGLNLLENAADFPDKGPVLIITDGYCDSLSTTHEHAFLLPIGRSLPFPPRGPVFYIR